MMLASDLAFKHMGKKFRSLQYPNKNKTAKPKPTTVYTLAGKMEWARAPREWVLWDLSWFHNGNIIVNGGQFYLRPDTELDLVEEVE